ncbi:MULTISPECIES: hypothetical protein [unclassified Coleofasciculus]|uniref:hypothetical protein n=1 Tax=unclassified Coleofasciculus TaxID=2692782 RepID=UPI001881D779|nr:MULTISPECIES: hypothetical protein [unclassified Coleofasciculus]MBE9126102.1 hypothetical protein [Coleofasciculus sp. LEGE 07081]MBE9147543.1 hypothetical protein [Coleofasciculus sp. LEGE 07092]
MKPKLKTPLAWQQAELLMQPALIRIVDHIRKQLEQTTWKATYKDVETPIPGHEVCLEKADHSMCISLWELCFQVCFRDYSLTHSELETQEVEIDTSLIDEEGEVDWQSLDSKAQKLVEQVFADFATV